MIPLTRWTARTRIWGSPTWLAEFPGEGYPKPTTFRKGNSQLMQGVIEVSKVHIPNWDCCIWRSWINPGCTSWLDPIDGKSSCELELGLRLLNHSYHWITLMNWIFKIESKFSCFKILRFFFIVPKWIKFKLNLEKPGICCGSRDRIPLSDPIATTVDTTKC